MFGSQQRQELGKVFHDANAEAARMGDRRIGTEHVTLAMLADPNSVTAKALAVSLDEARKALQALDSAALAAVGIEAVDPGPGAQPARVRMRLTPGARDVFSGLKANRSAKPPRPQHVLLGLLDCAKPDPAAELIDALGVDRAQVRQRLQAS
jgi:ATP-dependent Clp protease ATP-binding subunit ClpA